MHSTSLFNNQREPMIPNYRIVKLLGSGGMGDVYEAEHVVLRKRVAIKTMKAHLQDSIALMRFQSEAQAAGRIKHPNIVSVFDCGVSETGEPYMIMDKIEGATLSQLLESEGTLKIDEALGIILQVCEGVRCAHDNGILHRDLKPSNVILEVEGSTVTAKVLDFGIAKILSSEGPTMNLTRTGELFGTPSYMSPEQSNGEKVSQCSDVYSIGCILYEILTGQPPFIGKTAMEVMIKHMTEAPLPLSQAALKKFPAGLEALVGRAIAKKPSERFASMSEFIKAIHDFQQGVVSPSDVAGKVTGSRSKLKGPVFLFSLVGGGISLILIAVLMAWALNITPPVSNIQEPSPSAAEKEHALASVHTETPTPDSSGKTTGLPGDIPLTGYKPAESDNDAFERYLSEHHLDTKLSANGFSDITSDALKSLNNRPDLDTLDLSNCGNITDEALANLSNCKMLTELKLPGCPRITESGLQHFSKLPSLRLLDLSKTNIRDDVFKVIGKLPLLSLNLSHTKITDKTFTSGDANSTLIALYLKDTGVSDRGLESIAKLKGLQTLVLDDCPKVDDAGIKFLSRTNINQLDLKRTSITDKAIEYLLQMKKLRHVNLSETEIDGRALTKLSTSGLLSQLEVKKCPAISEADVKEFQKRSHCKILFGN